MDKTFFKKRGHNTTFAQLVIAIVNYKLALTKALPTTEQQRHFPSASMDIESHAAIAVDLQQLLREFRVE